MERDPNKVTAFPVPVGQTCDDFQGMTLRDYFAAKAMAALLAWPGDESVLSWQEVGMNQLASQAYRYADAMIVARGGEPGGSS
jgi:hypothetical protein